MIELLKFSSEKETQLFLVGGTLRDHILQKDISDIDLTGIEAANLAVQYAQSKKFSYVPLDKTPGRSTIRIILSREKHFDLTDMQGTTIEEDLRQRDFTINAMGQELSDFLDSRQTFIDLFDGINDLSNAIVRATSNSVFQSDPLRMLRAFRFAAKLNFSIANETLEEISQNKKNISKTAGERIWSELLTFLGAERTGERVGLMDKTGLLACLLPLTGFKNYQDQYNRLEHILSNLDQYFPGKYNQIELGDKVLLKLAFLLKNADSHISIEDKTAKDFGTPKTYETLKGLKASNNEIAFICKCIQNSTFLSSSLSNKLDDEARYNLCVTGGNELPASILLHACTLPFPPGSPDLKNKSMIACTEILDFRLDKYIPVLGEKALLNGNDIIRKFKISPSPAIGDILKNIQRAQVLGEIKTSTEAEILAEKILNSQEQN